MRLGWRFWAGVAACAGGPWLAGTGCSPSSAASPAPDGGVIVEAGLDAPSDASSEGPSTDAPPGTMTPAATVSGCQPTSIAGYQPPAYIPTRPRSSACAGFFGDGGLVQSYRDACLDRSNAYPPCATFEPPDAAGAADCYDCLLTTGSAAGVTAPFGTYIVVNYNSCIERIDPTDAGLDCANAIFTSAACDLYACAANCPVTDDASLAAYLACLNMAESGVCADYSVRAQSCTSAEMGDGGTPVGQLCFAGSDAQDHYLSYARYLCGGG